MTRQEAARIVTVILAACPAQSARVDASRATGMVDAYAALLEDLSYEQCSAAVRVLLQTKTWMPSVAEIRSAIVELQIGPVSPGGEQWGEVLRAVGRYGSYRKPGTDFQFKHPVTARCVAALGWAEICLSENTVADRARFIDLFDKLAVQQQRESVSPTLAAAKTARAIGEAQPIAALLPQTEKS